MSSWTTLLPSHFNVVRCPSVGSPVWIHFNRSLPLRMLRCVPRANHKTTPIMTIVRAAARMDPRSGIAVAAYGRAGGRVKTRRCYIAPTGTLRIHRVGSMTERKHGSERGRSGFGRLREAWREFAYGMLGYEFSQHAREMRNSLETVF